MSSTNQQEKRRRTLDAISHLFLSCQNAYTEASEEPQTPPSCVIDRLTEGGKGLGSRGSIELVLRPDLYPVVKLVWKEGPFHGVVVEATAALDKGGWLHLATACKERARQIDAFASQEATSVWGLFADSIMREIRGEEKRARNREAYQSFGDFVAEISRRTDLDKIRKAQMIHDQACGLKLQ
ncbi:MAG TPA: hypothetical protein VEI04_10435 [Syntrophobacteria bacterium]|nr:hypothetical protein [Syntrophobacteria bacterium]